MTRGLFVVRCQVSIARRSKTFCINQQPSLCGQLQGDKRAGACDKWPMVSLNDSGAEPPQEKVLTRVRPMAFARWSCRTHEERYLQFGHMQPTDGRKWPPTTGVVCVVPYWEEVPYSSMSSCSTLELTSTGKGWPLACEN